MKHWRLAAALICLCSIAARANEPGPDGPATQADLPAIEAGNAAAQAPVPVLPPSLAPAPAPGRYFHTGFNSIYLGEAFRLGTADGPRQALAVPVIEHHASDGYWLIPGVNYNLFNVGATTDLHFERGSLLLGPSIDLGGPLDRLLLAGLNSLPDSGNYSALKCVLNDGRTKLAIMPMWELRTYRNDAGKLILKGYPDIVLALSRRWGGAALAVK